MHLLKLNVIIKGRMETERECSRFHHLLVLADDRPTFFGKPWWCYRCQWQFAEEDFPDMKCESQEK